MPTKQPLRILFLDDDEDRHDKFRAGTIGHDVAHVRTAVEAVKVLDAVDKFQAAPWDLICLDHDLTPGHQLVYLRGQPLPGLGEGTGYDVADWLRRHTEVRARLVVLHTFNEHGRTRMYAALRAGGFTGGGDRDLGRGRVAACPFGEHGLPMRATTGVAGFRYPGEPAA